MADYIEQLKTFDINNLPTLDTVVMGALELLSQTELPKIDISKYKRPIVVGSGNAEMTGRIIFGDIDAIFASECDFADKLANIPEIDGVVLISASGEKHAPIIASKAKSMGKPVTLITNSANSSTSKLFEGESNFNEYIFPKNREPYTYNTSTYLGMILGATGEDPALIKQYIEDHIKSIDMPDFKSINKYYLVIPNHFSAIKSMLTIKFIELFGRNIARDVETEDYLKLHATTVVPSDELFISFVGDISQLTNSQRNLEITLPEGCSYGTMMAIGYYIVGQIQKAYPNYFMDNIVDYTQRVSKILGKTISPIVEV